MKIRTTSSFTGVVAGQAVPTPAPTTFAKGADMSRKTLFAAAATAAVAAAGIAYAQFPVMDMVANKVIQKYQTSTCEQLWQERAQGQGKPKPEMEQRAMKLLREDPQMRQAFFDKVAGPIVNKMFECGMIP